MAGAASALAATVRLPSLLKFSRPLLAVSSSPNFQPNCSIVSKSLRDPNYKRPPPFPYKEKKFSLWNYFLDDVTARIDENSKIIVVDGPPTGNKDKFAREVADELDMLYIPNAHLDAVYVNKYGFDMRTLNHKMPEPMKSFDIEDFFKNPNHKQVANMQILYFLIRYEQYADAIEHVLNTGQGVVMMRSVYSDHVYADTMVKHGFMSRLARRMYEEIKQQGMVEYIRPHLSIYLDIPVDKVLSNIKARNKPAEQGSKFFTPEVLKTLETCYKQDYLKKISEHSEVLVYDWSEEGDSEVVVEDICRINFDCYNTRHDNKLRDWFFTSEDEWKSKRIMFSKYRGMMREWTNVPRAYCPELLVSGDELHQYYNVLDSAPGGRYEYGFNKKMGDSILFKM